LGNSKRSGKEGNVLIKKAKRGFREKRAICMPEQGSTSADTTKKKTAEEKATQRRGKGRRKSEEEINAHDFPGPRKRLTRKKTAASQERSKKKVRGGGSQLRKSVQRNESSTLSFIKTWA